MALHPECEVFAEDQTFIDVANVTLYLIMYFLNRKY